MQGSLGNAGSYIEKGETTFIFFSLFIRNNKPWLQHSKMLRLLVQQPPTIRLAIHKAASKNSPSHDTQSQKSAVVAVFLLTQHKKKLSLNGKYTSPKKIPNKIILKANIAVKKAKIQKEANCTMFVLSQRAWNKAKRSGLGKTTRQKKRNSIQSPN